MERLSLPAADQGGVSFLHQMSVGDTYPLHTHDFYEVFYVVRGRAMHCVNGENECCTAGTLALIRPEDRHAYSFINQWDMELISIGIAREVMAEILAFDWIPKEAVHREALPPRIWLDPQEAQALQRELMRLEGLSQPEARRQLGKALLARLIIGLLATPPAAAPLPDWLSGLLREMSQPDNLRLGLRRMIDLSHVSQNHLNREMKRCLGLTPTEFINAKRIALAGDLLLTRRYPGPEVAALCGFETMSHFHANFRKIYGCAPREFVARHERKENV